MPKTIYSFALLVALLGVPRLAPDMAGGINVCAAIACARAERA